MLGNVLVGSLILVGIFLVLLSSVALLRGVVVEGGSVGIGDVKFNLSGTLATLVVGILCFGGAGYILNGRGEFSSNGNASGAGSAVNNTTEAPAPGFTILAPTADQKVSGSKGVLFEGTAPPMGSDSLRIMTIASSSQDERVFYISSDDISPEGGKWSYQVGQIGAGVTDIGSRFTFVVIEASESCSQELNAKKPDQAGDTYFRSLPSGCRELGRVTLTKTSA